MENKQNITVLLKNHLQEKFEDLELITDDDKIGYLNELNIIKYAVFEIPISYNYETKAKEYFKIKASIEHNEFNEIIYNVVDIIYHDDSAKNLKEIYLDSSEIKQFWQKYNLYEYLENTYNLYLTESRIG
jgi:hypothetical protein